VQGDRALHAAEGRAGCRLEGLHIENGAAELIVISLQALLNDFDELLRPAPDYPLWTASASRAVGSPVYYTCNEQNNGCRDPDDVRGKRTEMQAFPRRPYMSMYWYSLQIPYRTVTGKREGVRRQSWRCWVLAHSYVYRS
jgi:hypothetical protein